MLGWIAARADLIAAPLLMAGALTYVMRQRSRGAMATDWGGATNQARLSWSSVVGAPGPLNLLPAPDLSAPRGENRFSSHPEIWQLPD